MKSNPVIVKHVKPPHVIAVGVLFVLVLVVIVIRFDKRHEVVHGEQSQQIAQTAARVSTPTAPAAQPQQPEPPKLSLLNNDPEYDRLRHLTPSDVIDSLPAYRDAVEKRENLIKSKVGNISDSSLYRTLAEEASKDFPEVNREDYYAAAKAEVQRQRQVYAAAHKEDYFIVGMYENYHPKIQKAVFNILKAGIAEDAEAFSRANFGASIPKQPAEFGGVKYDTDGLGDGVEFSKGNKPYVVSNDRYQPDWLTGCWGGIFTSDCSGALVVSVTPEQMDAVYPAVRRLMGAEMERLYTEEITAGGDHETIGGTTLYNSYSKYPGYLVGVKERIEQFVRRQSIWLLGKGDPMDPYHVKVREAYLAVGNEQFGKIK